MLNWNPPFGSRREQPKARRLKKTVKPILEVLEDRTMPSVSPENPLAAVAVALLPPVPFVAAYSGAAHLLGC